MNIKLLNISTFHLMHSRALEFSNICEIILIIKIVFNSNFKSSNSSNLWRGPCADPTALVSFANALTHGGPVRPHYTKLANVEKTKFSTFLRLWHPSATHHHPRPTHSHSLFLCRCLCMCQCRCLCMCLCVCLCLGIF